MSHCFLPAHHLWRITITIPSALQPAPTKPPRPEILKKRIRVALAASVLLFFFLYYSLLFLKAKPLAVQQDLTRALESISGGQFQTESFSLSYFPTLNGEFKNASLTVTDPVDGDFRAEKIKIRFGFFGFLFGKPDISEIEAEGSAFHARLPSRFPFRSIDAQNVKLKARLIQSFHKIQIQWEGDLEGVKRSFSGKFSLGLDDPAKRDWNQVFLSGDLWLKEFPLEILKNSFFEENNIQVIRGRVNGQYRLQKDKRDPWVIANGRFHAVDFVYEIRDESAKLRSPASLLDAEIEIGWQPLEEQVHLRRSAIQLPFGKLQVTGKLQAGSHEIKDARIMISDLKLELLPQYYLPFREAVPFNLGFSGNSILEMSLEGAFDHLSFHGNWDFGPAFLNYGNFFSKPKAVPCEMSFDFLLKDLRLMSGDFSIKLAGAGFKGTVADFDLENGSGELNLLSNKFTLERWAPLLPLFSGYELSGELKVLANFSGSLLRQPNDVKSMVNVILEKGTIQKDEEALRGIYFAIDYSPLSFELKEGQVLAGDYPVFFNAVVFDPRTFPRAKLTVRSEKADISKLISSIDAVGGKWLTPEQRGALKRIGPAVEDWLPEGVTLNRVSAEVESKDKQIILNELKCEVYDGQVMLKGKIDSQAAEPDYTAELNIDRLSLAKYFGRNNKKAKLMEGNFFAHGEFQGKGFSENEWQKSLSGNGKVSVTNGSFNSFSMMKTISNISVFSLLLPQAPEITQFDDFQADFKLSGNKFSTEKAVLISQDLKAEGGGEMALEGLLNYRLDAYLSARLLKDFVGNFFGGGASDAGEDYLGPIPMLLSGDRNQPELKTDPSKIAEFTENFTKKKTQKVLRNFLPEDVLFKRPSKP